MTNHAARAADHLAAVSATRDELRIELANPASKAHTVNVLRDDLRNGVKLAQVHALLNIGHHLAALASSGHAVADAARLETRRYGL